MKITNGNTKLSASIPSINLPAGITCRTYECVACWKLKKGQTVVFDKH